MKEIKAISNSLSIKELTVELSKQVDTNKKYKAKIEKLKEQLSVQKKENKRLVNGIHKAIINIEDTSKLINRIRDETNEDLLEE